VFIPDTAEPHKFSICRDGRRGKPTSSVQTHSKDSLADSGLLFRSKNSATPAKPAPWQETGGRCPSQIWVPAFAGKTRTGASR
jgi:hypothetical protein